MGDNERNHCAIHDLNMERLSKMEEQVQYLLNRDAILSTRFDTLCQKIDSLTDRIGKQCEIMTASHEEWAISNAENKKDHENMHTRILNNENYIKCLNEDKDKKEDDKTKSSNFSDSLNKGWKKFQDNLGFIVIIGALWFIVWAMSKNILFHEIIKIFSK